MSLMDHPQQAAARSSSVKKLTGSSPSKAAITPSKSPILNALGPRCAPPVRTLSHSASQWAARRPGRVRTTGSITVLVSESEDVVASSDAWSRARFLARAAMSLRTHFAIGHMRFNGVAHRTQPANLQTSSRPDLRYPTFDTNCGDHGPWRRAARLTRAGHREIIRRTLTFHPIYLGPTFTEGKLPLPRFHILTSRHHADCHASHAGNGHMCKPR